MCARTHTMLLLLGASVSVPTAKNKVLPNFLHVTWRERWWILKGEQRLMCGTSEREVDEGSQQMRVVREREWEEGREPEKRVTTGRMFPVTNLRAWIMRWGVSVSVTMSHVGSNGEKIAAHLCVTRIRLCVRAFHQSWPKRSFSCQWMQQQTVRTRVSWTNTQTRLSMVGFFVHVFDTKKLLSTSDLPPSINVQRQLSCLCLVFITPSSLVFSQLVYFPLHLLTTTLSLRRDLLSVSLRRRERAEMFLGNCTSRRPLPS